MSMSMEATWKHGSNNMKHETHEKHGYDEHGSMSMETWNMKHGNMKHGSMSRRRHEHEA
jgi:hypothetical protein